MVARRHRRDARVSSFDLYAAPNRRLKEGERPSDTVPSHKRIPAMERSGPLSFPLVDPHLLDAMMGSFSRLLGLPYYGRNWA